MARTLDEITSHLRACIENNSISTTLIQTEDLSALCDAAEFGMKLENEDYRDASLFRFWVKMASSEPSKVAIAISSCTSTDEYRAALTTLAIAKGINLP